MKTRLHVVGRLTRGIVRLFDLVLSGDPLGIGIAIVIGLAGVGFVILALRSKKPTEPPTPDRPKKRRWPQDVPPADPSNRM